MPTATLALMPFSTSRLTSISSATPSTDWPAHADRRAASESRPQARRGIRRSHARRVPILRYGDTQTVRPAGHCRPPASEHPHRLLLLLLTDHGPSPQAAPARLLAL